MKRKIDICLKCDRFNVIGQTESPDATHSIWVCCDVSSNERYLHVVGRDWLKAYGIRREYERKELPEECVFRTERCIDEWNDDSDDIGLQEMQLFH
jgi:hypothetical protein